MTNDETREVFETRLFQWSRTEFRTEIDEGFPTLRTFPSGPGGRAMAVMERLSVAERYALAAALVKRWVPRAAEAADDPMTRTDHVVLSDFESLKARLAADPEGHPEWAIRDDFRSGARRRLKRKALAQPVRRAFRSMFGDDGLEIDEGAWRYRVALGRWSLHTYVDLAGRFHQLTYSHDITDDEGLCVVNHGSALAFFGISAQTYWSDLADVDRDVVVGCLETLCRRFIAIAPDLLDGL